MSDRPPATFMNVSEVAGAERANTGLPGNSLDPSTATESLQTTVFSAEERPEQLEDEPTVPVDDDDVQEPLHPEEEAENSSVSNNTYVLQIEPDTNRNKCGLQCKLLMLAIAGIVIIGAVGTSIALVKTYQDHDDTGQADSWCFSYLQPRFLHCNVSQIMLSTNGTSYCFETRCVDGEIKQGELFICEADKKVMEQYQHNKDDPEVKKIAATGC